MILEKSVVITLQIETCLIFLATSQVQPGPDPSARGCVGAAKGSSFEEVLFPEAQWALEDTVCSLQLAWLQLTESCSSGLQVPAHSGINFLKCKSFQIAEHDAVCHHYENKLLWEATASLSESHLPTSHLHPFMLICFRGFLRGWGRSSLQHQCKTLLKSVSCCLTIRISFLITPSFQYTVITSTVPCCYIVHLFCLQVFKISLQHRWL